MAYSPTIQFLPLGQAGVIRCYVQANPALQFVMWTKDQRPFETNALPNVLSLNNGSLLVREVNQETQGAYQCTPYNEHGTGGPSNTMEVLVRGTCCIIQTRAAAVVRRARELRPAD